MGRSQCRLAVVSRLLFEGCYGLSAVGRFYRLVAFFGVRCYVWSLSAGYCGFIAMRVDCFVSGVVDWSLWVDYCVLQSLCVWRCVSATLVTLTGRCYGWILISRWGQTTQDIARKKNEKNSGHHTVSKPPRILLPSFYLTSDLLAISIPKLFVIAQLLWLPTMAVAV